MLEISVHNPEMFGKTLGELPAELPAGIQFVLVRRLQQNEPASPGFIVAENDVLLAVAPDKAALDQAGRILGRQVHGRLMPDRRDFDYLRVFASRPAIVGRTIGSLELPGTKGSIIMHVRRGDTDLLALPDLILEFGDRIGVVAGRADFPALRKFFGDSIKGTAEFSYISVGLGMALGFIVGLIPIPIPGIGKIVLGLAGVLIVALVLGNLRRTGSMNWTIPLSANLVLRNLGLTLFLAQVGMSSGPKFAATIAETGFVMLGLGAILLLALVLPVMILGIWAFRIPYDEVAGIVSGACGNPAILAFSTRLAPTDKPDLGFAMIFPGMTIAKILFVNIAAALLQG
jgi:putative transport protein